MDSIWSGTLGSFRDRLASVESVPAGVSTAAISAVFGLGLLTKALAIASKRKDFQGDRQMVAALLDEARTQSQILSKCADEDIAGFHQRSRAVIEVPLQIARAAATGVELCARAVEFVHAAVAPDLSTGATLLAAALRSTLFSLEANLEQLPSGDPYREEVSAEARQLLQKCEPLKLPSRPIRAGR